MRETNQKAIDLAPMTVDEYIRYEWTADCRHEFINGQLFEMPGERDINNERAGAAYIFFTVTLKAKGYKVFSHDIKVASHDRRKYFYPDLFVTKERETEGNAYIKYEPELIVEVVSPSSRLTDTVDKYIDYSAIPSMKYYLVVEPEITYVTLHAKNAEGKWEATLYASLTDVIPLPLLETALPLAEVYK